VTRRDPRRMSEMDLHLYIVGLLRVLAVPGVWWNHSPNGELRDKATGAKLKRMGTSAGYPDLEIFIPGGWLTFIEVKGDGGRLSPEQLQWKTYLEGLSCKYLVAKTPEQARAFLIECGAVRASSGSLQARGKRSPAEGA
jgi:hypothetical protein